MYRQQVRTLAFQSGLTALGLIVLGVVIALRPALVPFSYFEFWTMKGSLWEAVVGAWPLYAFMIGLNVMHSFFQRDNYKEKPHEILFVGLLISCWAGIAEEIFFRWLAFFGAIILIPFLDWMIWFVTGLHIVQWFYADIVCPIANFFTLGYLHPILLDGYGWAVGAAVITANGQFRNGHAYQGLFGFTLSWFFGMYMFWVMFNYGLPACILIHFITDVLVFATVALDAKLEKL